MGRNGPHQIGRPTRRAVEAVEETLQHAKKGIYLQQKGRYDVEGTSNGKCAIKELAVQTVEGPHFILQARPEVCASMLTEWVNVGRCGDQ